MLAGVARVRFARNVISPSSKRWCFVRYGARKFSPEAAPCWAPVR